MNWLREHKFEAHLLAFSLMILPAVGLYFAARRGSQSWIWALLGVFVLGNLLAVVVR